MLLRETFLGSNMVDVAQLVRAADCGSVGRGFEPHLPPTQDFPCKENPFFITTL